jgi:transcription-repair coupling factor (superfamily II helicase)
MEPPNKHLLFTEQTKYFDGKTLFISNDVGEQIYKNTESLFQSEITWDELVKQTQKNIESRDEKMEHFQKVKNNKKTPTIQSKLDKERLLSDIMTESVICSLPKKYVLNSKEHYQRFHKTLKIPNHLNRTPNILPPSFNDGFDDQQNLNIASGIGSFDKTLMTPYQRNLMMNFYKNLFFICSNKDIVFGTNLPELVNIFISSDFVQSETISTLYQLMGRVGRIGRSYHANIILDSKESVDKILCLVDNVDSIEIHTLLDSFQHSSSIPF